MLELSRIRIDGGTQQRAELNENVVADYAEAMSRGEAFPPIVVFYDGTNYWVADGFHRYFGAKKAGLREVAEDVHPGSKLDAQLYSFGANATNGLRRSNADKRKAVMGALNHPVSKDWSDNQIAKHCGVDHKTVASVRASILGISQDSAREVTDGHLSETKDSGGKGLCERRIVSRNGATYQMDTSKIGKVAADLKHGTGEKFSRTDDGGAFGPSDEEIAESEAAEAKHRETLDKILESDEPLKAANEKIKQQEFQIHGLEARMAGLMNELAAAKRQAKYWKEQATKWGAVVA